MTLKKTPLHVRHLELGARMGPFAGYDMPISYDSKTGGMLKEHLAVRSGAGIFDVCHMGEFWVRGKAATKFLSHVCTRSAEKLENFRAQYCLLLHENGGIVDDIIIYRVDEETYWVVVNAANIDKDFKHLADQLARFPERDQVRLQNVSEATGLIALQGPGALSIIEKCIPEAAALKYYRFLLNPASMRAKDSDHPVVVARTGYTGEDGFEVFLPAERAVELWDRFSALGALPIGLGARDTLRLEVGFSLYGHELSDTLSPQETFSAFAFDSKHSCVGADRARAKSAHRPIALIGDTPKPMRAEEKIRWNDKEVGVLTSGSTSPILKKGIGLGLVESAKVPPEIFESNESVVFVLESGGKFREARLTKTPFVSTARVKGVTKSFAN